jgi:DNA-binding YbaB/EbfC family protein
VFPSGSEGFDVSQLLQQAQRMQEQFMSAQQNLADAEVTGTAGGGLVNATVAGNGELVSLEIDPDVVDPEDVETLADLIVAAVRDGNAQVQRLAAEQMGPLGQGLNLNDLGGALGGAGDDLKGMLGGVLGESSGAGEPGTGEPGPDEPGDDNVDPSGSAGSGA